MKMLSTMRKLDATRGAVRVEDVYDTGIADLWQACTDPERLQRWIATVEGDLKVGGSLHLSFASSWTGPARIESCEEPTHLLLTLEPGGKDETQVEAWLIEEGSRTRLRVEERGLPADGLHYYASGWQAHLEDLRSALTQDGPVHPDGWSAEAPASGWRERWSVLTPAYEESVPR